MRTARSFRILSPTIDAAYVRQCAPIFLEENAQRQTRITSAEVPATFGLALERSASPWGSLLAVWLETGVAPVSVSGVPTVASTDPQHVEVCDVGDDWD